MSSWWVMWEARERTISSWDGGIGGIVEVEGSEFGVWVSVMGLRLVGFLGGLEEEGGGWVLEPEAAMGVGEGQKLREIISFTWVPTRITKISKYKKSPLINYFTKKIIFTL